MESSKKLINLEGLGAYHKNVVIPKINEALSQGLKFKFVSDINAIPTPTDGSSDSVHQQFFNDYNKTLVFSKTKLGEQEATDSYQEDTITLRQLSPETEEYESIESVFAYTGVTLSIEDTNNDEVVTLYEWKNADKVKVYTVGKDTSIVGKRAYTYEMIYPLGIVVTDLSYADTMYNDPSSLRPEVTSFVDVNKGEHFDYFPVFDSNNKFVQWEYIGTTEADIDQIGFDAIKLTEDLVITEKVGAIELTDEGGLTKTYKQGASLDTIIKDMLVKESTPSIATNPSITISLIDNGTKSSYLEVGTSVTPKCTITYSDGTYGNSKNVLANAAVTWLSVTGQDASDIAGFNAQDNKNLISFTGDEQVLTEDGISIAATAIYGNGDYAVTNMGKTTNVRISAISVANDNTSKSATITGYRNSFYGTTTNKNTLTDSAVRALTKSGKALLKDSTFAVEVPVGAMRVVIAYPATLGNITSITDKNGLNANITSAFTKQTMKISGASNYYPIVYNVYTLEYAAANNTNNTYNVTI